MKNRAARAAVIVTALSGVSLLTPSLASATVPVGGGGRAYDCISSPVKLYKSGNTVIGKMKLDCMSYSVLMRVNTVFDRTGGGKAHRTFYKAGVECTKRYTCYATVGVQDVRGRQRYFFSNEPSNNGTAVSNGKYGVRTCASGIHCTVKVAYF